MTMKNSERIARLERQVKGLITITETALGMGDRPMQPPWWIVPPSWFPDEESLQGYRQHMIETHGQPPAWSAWAEQR